VDFTQGVGAKWHQFFTSLEHNYGLNHDNPAHIWLLHHLFLSTINDDTHEWAESWNAHRMEISGSRNASPREMFLFGMLRDGPRGLEYLASPVEDQAMDEDELAVYGVDWEAQSDTSLMNHLLENDPQDWEDDNPFETISMPETMAEVICDPPRCPFGSEQRNALDQQLMEQVDMHSRDMQVRKLVWAKALEICRNIFVS
jgi:hypothetical protein